ncbi:efflux RND transporter periplasmic adaptor subunit [Luteimonas vadosa]|uniref:Efflux RND transporter periplasmic adaptor subunit n=1 Tax=Luteimonas vadosa TaxID=1165507 RepID=A0ABP9E2S5_9GAMM
MNRPSKTVVIALGALTALVAVAGTAYWLGTQRNAVSTMSSGSAEKEVLYWYDPMYPDKQFDQPGKSPFMDLELVPKYAEAETTAEREPLYWYDPMYPDKQFDKPGKSPFMDMQLVPKYPDGEAGADDAGTVQVAAATLQNLGMRTTKVEIGTLSSGVRVPGSIAWDLRSAYEISARADGVIEKLYVRAPYESVRAGQALAELVAPEWSAAAQEFLALGRADSADARALQGAARNRLRVLGMDDAQIRSLRGGNPRVVLRAPADGIVSLLQVRQGQRVQAGMPLMTVNGLDTVWVEAAIPQAQAAGILPGTQVQASVSAFPGETFDGAVESLLPNVAAGTRTQIARIVLDNPDHRLAPGMFADLQFAGTGGQARPLVPDEALIATGSEARVIVAEGEGRFRPVRVSTGRSAGGKTEILRGLQGGERVVVSGQFLIDSEASLSGALERLTGPEQPASDPTQGRGDMAGMEMPALQPSKPPAADAAKPAGQDDWRAMSGMQGDGSEKPQPRERPR